MVLRHIWTENCWTDIVFFDPRTVENIAYYSILEGIVEVLLQWMIVATPDTDLTGWAYTWRGSLLRQICAAYLSHDTNADAGPAILCLLDVARQKDAAQAWNREPDRHVAERSTPMLGVSLRPAIIELYATLCTPFCYNTDPNLFEAFLELHRGKHGVVKRDSRYSATRLRLWHPTMPDEQEAISILREHHEHGIDDGTVLPMLGKALMKQSFQNFLQRTIDVASHNGNTSHVVWVKQTFKDMLRPGGTFDAPTQIGRPKTVPLSHSRARARATALSQEESTPKPERTDFPTFK